MRLIGWIVVIVVVVMVLSKACAASGGVPVLPERFRDTVPPTTVAPDPPKADSGGVPKIGDGLTPALPGVGPLGPALPPGVAGALKP